MCSNRFFYIFLLALPALASAQTSIIDDYVRKAWQSSAVLASKDIEMRKGMSALQEARSLYTPDISFGGTYTLAAGGRKIDLPVGDLLNPVYGTLNQLTQTNNFPRIDNVSEQFLPNNFYDVRFRVKQPILQPEIKINEAIKNELTGVQAADRDVYKRELARDVQVAYARYAQAYEAIEIYDRALVLLNENKRVSESLYRNGVGLPSAVMRAESEIARVASERDQAITQKNNAAAYFNFLLNLPYETPIVLDTAWLSLPQVPVLLADASGREELLQLQKTETIAQYALDLKELQWRPQLGAQLDLGSQAFNFGWGGYVLLGLSVDLPVWNNHRNDYKTAQSRADVELAQQQRIDISRKLNVQAYTSRTSLELALRQYETFEPRIESAKLLQRDVSKRFKEGQANYIEWLDAATQISRLESERSVLRLQAWQLFAEWQRATATYSLN